MASAEGRFQLEIFGMPALVALDATPPKKTHTPIEYQPANQVRPEHVRGNFKIDPCTFKHAVGIGQQGLQLFAWLEEWDSGVVVARLSGFFLTMDEGGLTPVERIEMIDCVPTAFSPEARTGAGTGIAAFSFSLQPRDIKVR